MEKFEVDLLYKNWNGLQSWEFYKVQVTYEYFIFLMGLLEPTND